MSNKGPTEGDAKILLDLLRAHNVAAMSQEDYVAFIALSGQEQPSTKAQLDSLVAIIDKMTFNPGSTVSLEDLGFDPLKDRGQDDFLSLKLLQKAAASKVVFQARFIGDEFVDKYGETAKFNRYG